MICVACAADVPDEDVFCENCGVRLSGIVVAAGGCSCGASSAEVDEDGYCLVCGKRVRRPESDHIEQARTPDFAAVSDRGQRHDRNEDRFATVQGVAGFGLVVCDGVSATRNAEVASAAVAEIIGGVLEEALAAEVTGNSEEVLRAAIARAAEALRAEGTPRDSDAAPSTTAVAALVLPGEITVAWVGDSRAYWVDEGGATQLTRDHSWRNLVVTNGEMTPEEADAAPQAHAITRWLGADAEDAALPELTRYAVTKSGILLLCSDGLWNYAVDPEQIAALLTHSGEQEALATARDLISYANGQGGRDNITVALLRIDVAKRPAEIATLNQEAELDVQGERGEHGGSVQGRNVSE